MYQANSANKSRNAALTSGTQTFEPQQLDLSTVLSDLLGGNIQNFGQARQLAGAGNKFAFGEFRRYANKLQPQFSALQSQIGTNALSFSRGELPNDVINSIGRASAERGIQSGIGYGSQGSTSGALASLNLRNLGLTSLDLSKYGTNLGIQVNQSAKSMLPQLGGAFDWLFGPSAGLQNAQFNTDWANRASLANVSAGNAVNANVADSAYASSLNQAAAVQQAGNQLSSLLGAYAQNSGTGGAGWGGNYSSTGQRGSATYNGRAIPTAKLA